MQPDTSNPAPAGRRPIGLPEILALSLALISPTLVLSANGQNLVRLTHVAPWKVYALGWIGVSAVGYSFGRLAGLGNGPGAAYLIVWQALGMRGGRITGMGLLGAYLSFAVACPLASASFLIDLLHQAGGRTTAIPLMVMDMFVLAAGIVVMRGQTASIMRLLLGVEICGIVLIAFLALFIMMVAHGHDMSHPDVVQDHFGGLGFLSGIVVAFMSWAGFEACMTLSDHHPRSDGMTRIALVGSIILSGVVFVGMMAVIQYGFESRLGGLSRLMTSSDVLADLGRAYLGEWSAIAFGIMALGSSFAGGVAALITASRLSRDLVGSFHNDGVACRHPLIERILSPYGLTLIIAVGHWGLCLLAHVTQSIPSDGIGLYGLFGSVGAICIMTAYFWVQIAALVAFHKRMVSVSWWENLIPLCGLLFIILTLGCCFLQAGSALTGLMIAGIWLLGGVLAATLSAGGP
ncbi:hypothetical protein BGC31_07230 [Komagataeibacter xylinus]|nr:amino acid permease-associated region [Komagataeibacter xylinus E25]RFP01099.1 hypothetical protein BGC31_07230 [Komagataeibacter xylinus]RFP04008.1 hypothetical protein BFX83_09325 [Komagataeibacter xylinus]